MNASTKAGLFCGIVALAVLGIEAWGADSKADPAKDVAAMHAVDQAWLTAYNSNDAEGIAKLYDENALLLPPGAPAMKGRAAIKSFLGSDMAASAKEGIKFSLGPNPDGGVSGNLGWVSGTYQVKDKSGKVIDAGKYLSVSMKKGGKWYYIRDTWNSDAAAAPSPPPAKK